jgi:DNA polymerase I-like protein with 3'-5' exonuclease and polymerase domains
MRVFDIEADDLLPGITKIHCVSYTDDGKNIYTIFDYDKMRTFFLSSKFLAGHNIIRYDIRAVHKVLGIKITAKLYDTLAMSWVFEPSRSKHGLASWGEDFGVPKPEVDDWQGLTPEQYQHRCEEDVRINWLLWQKLIKKADMIYKDKPELDRFLQYLTFKMESAAKAEDSGWKVDLPLVKQCIDTLTQQQEEKFEELRQHMPMHTTYRKKSLPKCLQDGDGRNKDGSMSKTARDWYQLLDEQGLPRGFKQDIDVVQKVEVANPNSSAQVKSWLDSLGWEPCTFDYKKDDNGKERTVPQVRKQGELTPSVQLLIEKNPGVEILDGLTVIQHRLSIFKGFLECAVDGYLKAEIDGFTNTLRFKHKKPLVNLPGVDKPWGKEVRGALIAPEGYTQCGADMVSLESTTKRHYLFPYDPDYVREMSQEGFDEHLDLAVRADYIKPDDYDFYTRSNEDTVNDKERFNKIKGVRKLFKPVNYSAIYGVGQRKLSRTAGMSETEAATLLEAYWTRNKGITEFSKDMLKGVRTLGGQMWVKNPVSGFWYSLRYEKDVFSTLNQSTGVYCFDTWMAFYLSRRPNIVGQFHDESINYVKKGDEEIHEKVLRWAIAQANKKLKLNVALDIDVQYGARYADIH